jgi:hypothetical protein
VPLVPTLKPTVTLVTKTELKLQSVIVQPKLIPLKDKLFAHLVKFNVKTVKDLLLTVLNVKMDMLVPQTVQSPHQVEDLPELLICQSDQSKLSLVLTVVKPVLKTVPIVKSVVLTDPTHHIVVVSLDTIKMPPKPLVLNVKLVTITVSPVKILDLGVYSHVQKTESMFQLVDVQTELMMIFLMPSVQIVTNTV